MIYRREVLPFAGREVNVDLRKVARTNLTDHRSRRLLCEWIDADLVGVAVVDPRAVIAPEHWPKLESFIEKASGKTDHHKYKCAIAALYLITLGKRVGLHNDSRSGYSGGWADVITHDDSIVVECGMLSHFRKIEAALHDGQTMMLMPYDGTELAYMFWPKKLEELRAKMSDVLLEDSPGKGLI